MLRLLAIIEVFTLTQANFADYTFGCPAGFVLTKFGVKFVQSGNGWVCAGSTDKSIDEGMDAACTGSYIGTRNLRGAEAESFGNGNLIIKNLDKTVFPVKGFSPACDEAGEFCGGSCTKKGRRVCRSGDESNTPLSCWQSLDDINFAGINPNDGNKQRDCWLNRNGEPSGVSAICVKCVPDTGNSAPTPPPSPYPCETIVYAGIPATVHITPSDLASGICAIGQTNCVFKVNGVSGAPVANCELDVAVADQNKVFAVSFTPSSTGSSGLHQKAACGAEGILSPASYLFVIDADITGKVILVTGANGGCSFLNPNNGVDLVGNDNCQQFIGNNGVTVTGLTGKRVAVEIVVAVQSNIKILCF